MISVTTVRTEAETAFIPFFTDLSNQFLLPPNFTPFALEHQS